MQVKLVWDKWEWDKWVWEWEEWDRWVWDIWAWEVKLIMKMMKIKILCFWRKRQMNIIGLQTKVLNL